MSTYDKRLDALEKDTAIMKQDIIYKLDDTNTAVGMIKGIVGNQGRDIKVLINQVKTVDLHLDGIDLRLDGVDSRLDGVDSRLETLNNRLVSLEQNVNSRFGALDQRLDGLDKKFDQVLQVLSTLVVKPDQEA